MVIAGVVPMRLDVTALRKVRGRQEDFSFSVPSFPVQTPAGEINFRDLEVTGRLTNTGREILVQGEVSARAELTCSLCLRPFTFSLTFPLVETYCRPQEAIAPEDEDVVVRFYEEEEIFLDDAVAEGLILFLPMKPVCRQECRGLCPVCGWDLNAGDCGCSREAVASSVLAFREALGQLKERLKGGS